MASTRTPKKTVITAAGLGSRLLPMTKELPKEMLPIYTGSRDRLVLKPLLQALFEQLSAYGMREFCFIVGRGKRAIEDHFTPDPIFMESLNDSGKASARDLAGFYEMIEDSNIVWINQPVARGFGHAVLLSRPFVDAESFLLTAGDTLILSKGASFLTRMVNTFERSRAAVILLLQEVADPRPYGVVSYSEKLDGVFKINEVTEKPERPKTNLAIMPFYILTPLIFEAIEHVKPGKGSEIQLTDGIQRLIDDRKTVLGVELRQDELRLDIGTPETYWEAQTASYQHFVQKRARAK